MRLEPHQHELPLVGGSAVAPEPVRRFNKRARGIDRCESPLERQLALAFAEFEAFAWRTDRDHSWCVGRWEQLSLVLLAQPICGPFRADFALVPRGSTRRDPLRVIAEVDGFEFHDASRKQARFDRRRDRYLIDHGSTVLHFAGSEIWKDAAGCAAEAVRIAARLGAASAIHP